MAHDYKHTQPGYVTTAVLGASLLFLARPLLKGGARLALLPAALITGAAGVLFSSQTIEIRDGKLRSYFGPGLPATTVHIRDIASVEMVQNPWWYGWGIKYTPDGMLYNVSGLQAVEICRTDGRRLRLGTDEPAALHHAVLQAMEAERANAA